MQIEPGARVVLDVEKAAAGGRMLARHNGRVVLVSGAIPGERVTARVERVANGVAYAEAVNVLAPSPDRRDAPEDGRCGGNVLAHVSYPRQLEIKGEIIQDAFARIAHVPLGGVPDVIGSPEHGYRMRARLHVQGGKLGFFREGSHQLCDAAMTRQLLPSTHEWIEHAERILSSDGPSGVAGVEIAENIAGDRRVCHLELHAGVDPERFTSLGTGLNGLSAERTDRAGVTQITGSSIVTDTLRVLGDAAGPTLTLGRDVRAFFQGNRFLIERLVSRIVSLVPSGPVVDLYAGVGLFGLSLAAAGGHTVTLVEGDAISGADLQRNAQPFGDAVRVERRSVEAFLRAGGPAGRARAVAGYTEATFIVDPPRTGMTRDAVAGIIDKRPGRLVYVSCDVATLARDTRILIDAGYTLGSVTGMDLFPNTAHVETIALFTR